MNVLLQGLADFMNDFERVLKGQNFYEQAGVFAAEFIYLIGLDRGFAPGILSLLLQDLIARRDLLFFARRKEGKRSAKGKPFRRVSLWTPFLADTEGSALWTPALRGTSLQPCPLLNPLPLK